MDELEHKYTSSRKINKFIHINMTLKEKDSSPRATMKIVNLLTHFLEINRIQI
jgi:hypothetical protein